MKKTKKFDHTIFDANILQIAKVKFDEISGYKEKYHLSSFVVTQGSESWYYDNFDEFLADYRKSASHSNLLLQFSNYLFELSTSAMFKDTLVGVAAPADKK